MRSLPYLSSMVLQYETTEILNKNLNRIKAKPSMLVMRYVESIWYTIWPTAVVMTTGMLLYHNLSTSITSNCSIIWTTKKEKKKKVKYNYITWIHNLHAKFHNTPLSDICTLLCKMTNAKGKLDAFVDNLLPFFCFHKRNLFLKGENYRPKVKNRKDSQEEAQAQWNIF